jgi:exosortase
MKADGASVASPGDANQWMRMIRSVSPMAIGLALLAVPLLMDLASQTWRQEDGIQGPFVLATAAWLFWRHWDKLEGVQPPKTVWPAFGLMVLSLALFVFGRATDYVTFEAAGVYGAIFCAFGARFGVKGLKLFWFPFLYLLFAVPPPTYLLNTMTIPLKHGAATVSTEILSAIGLPVVHEGVTILVAQYQLLVEDACSGMNSIIGLTAVCLLYIHLSRASHPAYALLLAALAPPIAIMANTVRIMAIILITYSFGDAVAQSFIHQLAGLLLFAVALLLIFAIDSLIYPWVEKLRKPA